VPAVQRPQRLQRELAREAGANVSAAALLAALLAILPHTTRTQCIERRAAVIAAQAEHSATRHGVPIAILLAVGFRESALGCDPRSGGSWGSPISRTRRSVAGTSDHAASALALGHNRCRSWPSAVSHFRCGMCRCPRLVGYQPEDAIRLAGRIAFADGRAR
jgi:hypothetical protein